MSYQAIYFQRETENLLVSTQGIIIHAILMNHPWAEHIKLSDLCQR